MTPPSAPVRHNEPAQRFELDTDPGVAILAYEPVGEGVLDLQHTVVPEAARGGGVGAALVRAAFDHARAAGVQVVPTCPYVAAWLERHPDQRDLVAGG